LKNLLYKIALFPVTLVAGFLATKLSQRYADSLDGWDDQLEFDLDG
jgi:hypothetical protein